MWWKFAWRVDVYYVGGPLVSSRVFVVAPFHRIFFALQRFGHELGHAPPDEGHHHWAHFCMRSPGALRLRWIHTRITPAAARYFRDYCELQPDRSATARSSGQSQPAVETRPPGGAW